MPSQQEVKWSQLKVGIIVLVSVVLLCILLFVMTSASGLASFQHKIVANAYFSDSSGLKKGGEVDLEGVAIGEVKNIEISTDPAHKPVPVHVVMELNPHFRSSIRTDSMASLTKAGFVGDTVVNINSEAAHGTEFQSGGQLPTEESSNMDAVVAEAKTTVQSLNVTLGKLNEVLTGIQQGQGTVGQLMQNPELFNNLNASIKNLNGVVTKINNGHGTVGKLLNDDSLYNHLNDTAGKLDTIATNLQQGKGSAGKLLNDDTLYTNLNSSLAHLNSILAEADAGKGGLGLLVKDPAFANKLNDTVTNLDSLLSNVNAGKGTLGKFATDDTAYTNINKLLTSSTELVNTIRSDPKKYLTIHMKIF